MCTSSKHLRKMQKFERWKLHGRWRVYKGMQKLPYPVRAEDTKISQIVCNIDSVKIASNTKLSKWSMSLASLPRPVIDIHRMWQASNGLIDVQCQYMGPLSYDMPIVLYGRGKASELVISSVKPEVTASLGGTRAHIANLAIMAEATAR